jgi:uncharacterized protein YndB with AHSA1/START domain
MPSSARAAVTLPTDEQILIGGAWRYVMEAHGGFEVGFHGEFREIVPNERLVHTEIYEGMPDGDSPPALNTATFTDRGGRTTLELLTEVESRAMRDMIVESGMEGGVQEQMELLEELAISLR